MRGMIGWELRVFPIIGASSGVGRRASGAKSALASMQCARLLFLNARRPTPDEILPVRIHSLIRTVVAGTILLLTDCCFHPHPPAPWPLPKVAEAPFRGNWVQTLRLERGDREARFLAVIETDGDSLTLAGLSPMGQRIIRILWRDGKVIQEVDANLPVKIDGEAILRDVVFANWPPEALQAILAGTAWKAEFSGAQRKLMLGKRVWMTTAPETTPDGEGLLVDHVAEKYRVHVATVEKNAP